MANSASVNLIGHLGRDPEKRYLNTGDEVASFSMATTKKIREEEITTWWRCTVWGKPAGVIEQYVRKGDPIHVLGEPFERPYIDKDGVPRVSLEVNVLRFTLLGARKDAPVAHPSQAARAPAQTRQQASQAAQAPPASVPGYDAPFDDGIPF